MSLFLLVNLLLGLIVLAAIVSLVAWAIRTQSRDALGRTDDRRRHDRRPRVIAYFRALAERREHPRREHERDAGGPATA
jgi:hypothetical protein